MSIHVENLRTDIATLNPNARSLTVLRAPNSSYTRNDLEFYQRELQREVTNAANRAQSQARRNFIKSIRNGNIPPNMTFVEASEIVRTGKASGWDMHHVRPVARFPLEAGNVNNIEPMRHEDHMRWHQENEF